MSKLILVCGLPGSGKTTLAEELSKELGIACLHKDSIKEKLYDLLKLKTLEDSRDIGLKTVTLLYELVEEQLKREIDLIVESAFNHPEDYSIIDDWINKYNSDVYTIICTIDRDTRKKRFKERLRHYSHHDIERTHLEDWDKSDDFGYEDIPGKQIRVITDKPIKEIVKYIKKELL